MTRHLVARFLFTLGTVWISSAPPAFGQSRPDSPHPHIRVGQFVAVTSSESPRVMGRVTSVSATQLGVNDGSKVTMTQSNDGADVARGVAIGIGVGAPIGLLLDASRTSWRTVYAAHRTVSVSPVVLPKGLGVSGALRW